MKLSAVLWVSAALSLVLATAAEAHQYKYKSHKKSERHKQMCVCTMNEAELAIPSIPPIPPVPPVPPVPHTRNHAYWNMPVPPPGSPDIRVIRRGDGDENRIVIIRKHRRDGADANGDGRVTHREFITRAEKRFKELDEDDDGALSEDEAAPEPMPFTIPLPPTPPEPPEPPAWPAPPND